MLRKPSVGHVDKLKRCDAGIFVCPCVVPQEMFDFMRVLCARVLCDVRWYYFLCSLVFLQMYLLCFHYLFLVKDARERGLWIHGWIQDWLYMTLSVALQIHDWG